MRVTTALVDLDGACYRAAFATQKTTRHVTVEGEGEARASFASAKEMNEWLEENELTKDDVTIELEVVAEPAGHAIYVLKHMLKDIEYYTGSHVSELFLTGKDNFRDLLYDQYKATRQGRPKPINLAELRKYAIEKLGAVLVNGMEADDAISIRATELEEKGEDYWIVSQDKDLYTVPGWHYNPVTQEQELVDPATASFNFYVQLLTGDSTDNIPGIYRIGKVRAENILADCLEDIDFYNTCKAVYEEKGIPEDEMIRNGRLLHMLRHDKDLWEPPKMSRTVKCTITDEQLMKYPPSIPLAVSVRIELNKAGFKFKDDDRLSFVTNTNPEPLGTLHMWRDISRRCTYYEQELPDD